MVPLVFFQWLCLKMRQQICCSIIISLIKIIPNIGKYTAVYLKPICTLYVFCFLLLHSLFFPFFPLFCSICLDSQKDKAITRNTKRAFHEGSAWIHWGIPMWPATRLPRTLWSRSAIYSGWWWFLKQIHSRTTRSVERCRCWKMCSTGSTPWLVQLVADFVGSYPLDFVVRK